MPADLQFDWPPAAEFWHALQQTAPEFDAKIVQEVVKKLVRFNETKPAQVTRKMRIVYFNSRIDNPKLEL